LGLIAIAILVVFWWAETRYQRERSKRIGQFAGIKHPYVCNVCAYDMIAHVAKGLNKCPECGNTVFLSHYDIIIAKTLITLERVPTSFAPYHLYKPIAKDNRVAYHYCRTIVAESAHTAQMASERLYGNDALSIGASGLKHQGRFLVQPVLVLSHPANALAILKDDDLGLSDISDVIPTPGETIVDSR